MKREHDTPSDGGATPSPKKIKAEQNIKAEVKAEPKPKVKAEPKPKAMPKPTPKAESKSAWTADMKADLLDALLDQSGGAPDLGQIAARLGVTRAQVLDQLKPNRANLRRAVVEHVRGGGK
ncbi:hypothetical protein Q8F55_007897 [Vanrija albida]|uniref:Uncharacterized protein n=1 Tax=Vanrija albida TaxID=181172 RepID=A0ABR3PVQ6_9TREE